MLPGLLTPSLSTSFLLPFFFFPSFLPAASTNFQFPTSSFFEKKIKFPLLQLIQTGVDFRKSEQSLSDLVLFLNSISDSVVREPENQDLENASFQILTEIRLFITSSSVDQVLFISFPNFFQGKKKSKVTSTALTTVILCKDVIFCLYYLSFFFVLQCSCTYYSLNGVSLCSRLLLTLYHLSCQRPLLGSPVYLQGVWRLLNPLWIVLLTSVVLAICFPFSVRFVYIHALHSRHARLSPISFTLLFSLTRFVFLVQSF